ncbi:MAG: NAD-glutamate dehydrogenase, partial [Rhodanobacter sp.]
MNPTSATHDHSPSQAVSDELKKLGLAPQRLGQAQALCQVFLARLGSGDSAMHTPTQWAVIIASLLDFMQHRAGAQPLVRVLNPKEAHGGRSLLQIVTDDMPFLVDTVSMVVGRQLRIHTVIHPVVRVARDNAGALTGLTTGTDADVAGALESIMHFEIDRVSDADQAALKDAVEAALEDVREAVQDWAAMRDKALAIADDLPQRKLPLEVTAVAEASEFLRWLSADNFTFLGYREYAVAQTDGERVLSAVPSSGLGILRNSARTMVPRSLQSLVATDLPQS